MMEKRRPEDDPDWIVHFDDAYLADELAHCHRDLEQAGQAEHYARRALDLHPPTRVRRRAVDLVLLATAQLQQRDVERACETGAQAVRLLSGLRSNRGVEYLDEFRHAAGAVPGAAGGPRVPGQGGGGGRVGAGGTAVRSVRGR